MVKAPAKGQRSIRTESSMQGASMTAARLDAQGTSASLVATFDGKGVGLVATGAWIAEHAAEIETIVDDAAACYQTARSIDIDLGRLDRLDTFGAWLIERLKRAFAARGATTRIIGLSDSDRGLMDEVRLVNRTAGKDTFAANSILAMLDSIGRAVAEIGASLVLLAHLLGALTMVVLGTIAHPARLRLTSLVHHLERVGWRAVPIVGLSTFFIGAMAALYGAELVCWLYGGMTPDIFHARLREAISVPTFAVGMIKAPFMALVIGLVACVEGFEVDGSAASLGLKTTSSVVKSIFLVIVLDGFFAMFFAAIGM